MIGLLVFAAIIGLLDAHVRGQKSALSRMETTYKERASRWRTAHPTAAKSARWVGMLGALIHGTGPALKAYRADWSEHYKAGRDRARAKYGRIDPVEIDAEPVVPQVPKPTPAVKPPAPQGFHPVVHKGGRSAAPAPKESTPMIEVTGIAGLGTAMDEVVARKRAEADDAAAALSRAEGELVLAQHLAEVAPGILDNDPTAAAAIAAQVEDAQMAVSAQMARVAAADSQHAKAQVALGLLAPHRAVGEAVSSTPQASSNTTVYRDQ